MADSETAALKKRLRELAWDWLRRAGDDRSERVQGMKDAHYELLELVGLWDEEAQPAPATREENVAMASRLGESLRIPPGWRVVVVATDASGEFVGVWRNVDDSDTAAILQAALFGPHRVDHPR